MMRINNHSLSNQSQLSPSSPINLNPIKFIVSHTKNTGNKKHSSLPEEEKKQSNSNDDIQNLYISDSLDEMCCEDLNKR